MRHLPVEPPPFFHRGPSPAARLAFFALISVALLFTDTRFRYLESVRHAAGSVLYPLQRMLQLPADAVLYVGSYLASNRELSVENRELKERLLALAPAIQGYASLEQENARLRALMEVGARFAGAATPAEVLYSGHDPFSQKLFVDKGESAGVRPGQAVIDEVGVVGQVTRVFPSTAEVTLVTDKDQAVPVKIERSGVRSVLFGSGGGRLPELRFLSPNAEVQAGDRLVTSGIDGTYPAGLAVAHVVSVERETGQIFARVLCKPVAGVDRSLELLILGPAAASAPSRPREAAEPDAAQKGRGRRRP